MKPLYLLSILAIVFYATSCDLGVEPDEVEDEVTVPREVTPEERRRKEGANLFAAPGSMPAGTKMKQSRKVNLKNVGVKISKGGQLVATGDGGIAYEEERDVTSVSRALTKFVIGDAAMKMNLKLRDQPASETVEPYPLHGQTIVHDGDQLAMENVPGDEQKEALKSFRTEWFGGNSLFEDMAVKRRGEWGVSSDKILDAIFSETFTQATGDAKLSVQKFFTFEGTECAEVTVSLNKCRGTMVDSKGETVDIELQGFGTLYRSLDPAHTIRVDLGGTVQMKMNQGDVEMKFNGPFECLAQSDLTLPK